MILFVAGFVIVLVAWTVFSHALDLVARLPGLHFLNKTGGALLGLVKGCAILFLCAWVIHYLGHIIPEETVEQTHPSKFFLTTNPVALILGARGLIPCSRPVSASDRQVLSCSQTARRSKCPVAGHCPGSQTYLNVFTRKFISSQFHATLATLEGVCSATHPQKE